MNIVASIESHLRESDNPFGGKQAKPFGKKDGDGKEEKELTEGDPRFTGPIKDRLAAIQSGYSNVRAALSNVSQMISQLSAALGDAESGEGSDNDLHVAAAEALAAVANLYWKTGALVDPRDNAYPDPADLLAVTDTQNYSGQFG